MANHPRKVSKSTKAGVVFPVVRIKRNLCKGNYPYRISTGGAVYLAGVLDYLEAEVLELAGDAAKANKNKKFQITPPNIMLAIRNDSELDKLFGNVQISEAGAMPLVTSVVLPKSIEQNSEN